MTNIIKLKIRPATLVRYRTRITADKRLSYTSPKLPLPTSFIHKTLGEIVKYEKEMPLQ